ncbi:MAG: PLP-dependent aminotransferase family protein [Euryarchaeota archaeon]|nr:PLP-dependent aminotransferase family protein [Euryarchaeota archaeon]
MCFEISEENIGGYMIVTEKFFSGIGKRLRASEVRELLKWIKKGGIISFGGGMPDPKTFPVEEMKEIFSYIFSERKLGEEALQYGTTEGYNPLRETILEMLKKDGFKAIEDLDNIVITTGSQQALDLIAKVFIDPGDTIIVEAPTYLAALNAFAYFEPNFEVVPLDKEGMKVDLLEEKLGKLRKEGKNVKFIYTVPTAQNPAGTTMPNDRRRKLVDLAYEYDTIIIEDNPYGYLIFDDRVKFNHLGAFDDEGRVIYMSSFSKILSPGFRLGFIAGHKEFIRKLVLAKQAADLCTPSVTQMAANEFLRRGYLEKHVEKIKNIYKGKKEAMINALKTYMPEGTDWTNPVGGMFIWVTVEGVDTTEMVKTALERGVAYVHGRAFYPENARELGKNAMRLNFSYPTIEQINEGIKRLAEVVKEYKKK